MHSLPIPGCPRDWSCRTVQYDSRVLAGVGDATFAPRRPSLRGGCMISNVIGEVGEPVELSDWLEAGGTSDRARSARKWATQ